MASCCRRWVSYSLISPFSDLSFKPSIASFGASSSTAQCAWTWFARTSVLLLGFLLSLVFLFPQIPALCSFGNFWDCYSWRRFWDSLDLETDICSGERRRSFFLHWLLKLWIIRVQCMRIFILCRRRWSWIWSDLVVAVWFRYWSQTGRRGDFCILGKSTGRRFCLRNISVRNNWTMNMRL